MRHLPVAIVLFGALLSPAFAQTKPALREAASTSGKQGARDDVWLVSTRNLATPNTASQPGVMKLATRDQWAPATPAQLSSWKKPATATVVYVHGYGFESRKAQTVGWSFYQSLVRDLPADTKLRFVIWSWPSTEVRRRLRPRMDFYAKAARTDLDAYYLARWLSELDSGESVSLVGSSMGARVVTGALHLLAGGTNSGRRLADTEIVADRKINAVLISPAVHANWLYPNDRHGGAVNSVSRMLLVNNPSDSMLSRYWRIANGTPALGVVGLRTGAIFGEKQKKIEQYDASRIIGGNHGVEHYVRSPAIMAKVRETILKSSIPNTIDLHTRSRENSNIKPAQL